ncbi:MAG: hypothetical protein ACK5RO_10540 [Pseudobdellovibrionaceae bacterium]
MSQFLKTYMQAALIEAPHLRLDQVRLSLRPAVEGLSCRFVFAD